MAYTETDLAVCAEALAQLRQDAAITLEELSSGTAPLCVKLRAAYPAAVRETLLARDWGWARGRELAFPVPRPDGRWAAPYPPGVARVAALEDRLGRRVSGWEREGPLLLCREPFAACVVVRALEDVSAWPPEARRLLALCLARNLAVSVTGRRLDAELADEAWRRQLRAASLASAREGDPGPGAWGRSRYLEDLDNG